MVFWLVPRAFGARVMGIKQLLKVLPSIFEHTDKNVRAEVCSICDTNTCSVPLVTVCLSGQASGR